MVGQILLILWLKIENVTILVIIITANKKPIFPMKI